MKLAAKHLSILAGVAVTLGTGAAQAAPPPVRLGSAWDLREMSRDFPRAVPTFQQADAAAAAGKLDEAIALFQQAALLGPQSAAPPRRLCEIYTELDRREDALRACREALRFGDAPEDYRAMVGALMSGPRAPSSEDFVQALIMANGLAGRAPHVPAGQAALFDIAHRLGDRRLMRGLLHELVSNFPDHYDTGRARRIVGRPGPGPAALVGWGLLLALLAATAARGIGRLRVRSRLRGALTTGAALLLLLLAGGPARAETPVAGHLSDFEIDDADPEGTVPPRSEFRKDPLQFGYLVMDLADRADERVKRKDYEGAARFYRALAKVAPDRAIGFAKVCEVYELARDRGKALDACRRALVTEGARPEDYERFVRLTLAGTAPLDQVARTELNNVITHLRKADWGAAAADVECRLGLRQMDVALLQRCTAELARLSPDSENLISYDWALATLRKDGAAVDRALARAQKAGVDLAGLQRRQQATRRAEVTRVASFSLAGLLILAAAALLLRRRRELSAGLARRSAT